MLDQPAFSTAECSSGDPWLRLAPAGLAVNHQPSNPIRDSANDSPTEVDRLTLALIQKFEELTMIHQFTEQLRIDVDRDTICRDLIEPLRHCIAAVTVAIELYDDPSVTIAASLVQTGKPRDAVSLRLLADTAVAVCGDRVAIVNELLLAGEVTKRLLVIPIVRGNIRFGRMIAIGDNAAEEFGTIEADLMRSTSMMLAVHLANQRQYIELRQTLEGVLVSFVSALDAKDRYTCGHSARVAELAVAIAEGLCISAGEHETIRKSALLHDIGKIGINDSVLRKPGALTDAEFEVIKLHPVIGYNILKAIGPFANLLPGVLHHHEAWDGTGYPHGLAGHAIPRIAQILAVADSFDAMTSDRPYRDGMPLDRVLSIFKQGLGQQWAPDVGQVLVTHIESMFNMVRRAH